ncbi:MAG: hypothetical protein ACT4TC_21710 [Myxococcaceae bacterium]
MPRKVLLATMNVGGGHTALRDSFAQALGAVDPRRDRFDPIVWDSQDTRISGFYDFVIHHIPHVQQTVYDLSDVDLGVRVVSLAYPGIVREVRALLQQTRPDVVVSTHLVLSMMFARARRHLGMDVPLVSAIPDYGAATRGFFPEQEDLRGDFCITMDSATREGLLTDRGFAPEIIHLSGFLTRPSFKPRPSDRSALWAKLKKEHSRLGPLNPFRPTVIFLGGSAWTEKTDPVLDALLAQPKLLNRINTIVVCGRNAEFESALRAKVANAPQIAVFGFVSAELMASLQQLADFPVLGSLAPASLQELLETRCGPLMLFHYIPGTEGAHVQYIEDNDIGLYEPNALGMVDVIAQVVGAKERSPRVQHLKARFEQRAAELRAQNAKRALLLGDFLDRLCGDEAAERHAPMAATRLRILSKGSGQNAHRSAHSKAEARPSRERRAP